MMTFHRWWKGIAGAIGWSVAAGLALWYFVLNRQGGLLILWIMFVCAFVYLEGWLAGSKAERKAATGNAPSAPNVQAQ